MTNRDCFAYRCENKCLVLSEMLCCKKSCSFYKTVEQYKSDLEKYPGENRTEVDKND